MEQNLINEVNKNLEVQNNLQLAKVQNKFLESNLGQVINGGVDLGLKVLLPDYLEEEVIEIKDVLLQEGFSSAVKTAINQAVEFGKDIIGIFNGEFKNVQQAKAAIKEGGLITDISRIIDNLIGKAEEKNLINSTVGNIVKTGKEIIIDILNKNVDTNLENQMKSVEKLNTYIKNWNKGYEKQDFKEMEKEYKKIEKELKNLMPLESLINETRQVENIHNLIKNNGKNFNISQYEIEAAQKLI